MAESETCLYTCDTGKNLETIKQNITVCAICQNTLDVPQRLSCLHYFCKKCIEERTDAENSRGTMECPKCLLRGKYQNVDNTDIVTLFLSNFQESSNPIGIPGAKTNDLKKMKKDAKKNIENLKEEFKSYCYHLESRISKSNADRSGTEDMIDSFYTYLIADFSHHIRRQKNKMKEDLNAAVKMYQKECKKTQAWCQSMLDALSVRERLLEEMESESLNINEQSGIVDLLVKERDMYSASLKQNLIPKKEILFLPRRDEEIKMRETQYGSVITEVETAADENELLSDDDDVDASNIDNARLNSSIEPVEQSGNVDDLSLSSSVEQSYTVNDVTGEFNNLTTTEGEPSTSNDNVDATRSDSTIDANDGDTNTEPSCVPSSNEEEDGDLDTPPPYWSIVQDRNSVEFPPNNMEDRGLPREPPRYQPSQNACVFRSESVFINSPLLYANHLKSMRTRIPDDQKAGPIVGITWIQNKLVMVDRFNSKIKLFHEDGTFLHSIHFADGEPLDIANTSTPDVEGRSNSCAITIPKQRTILTLKVSDAGLYIQDRFVTKSGYTCLAWARLYANFVCGSSPPFGNPQIDITDAYGRILRSFALDYRQKPLFSQVRSIDVSSDGVISVCDWKHNRLLFLKVDGSILGSYAGTEEHPLLEPVGTTTDGRGNLMVSDSKSNSIHIVNHEAKFIGILKSSCKTPKPKEINIRQNGTPKLALSHGSVFVEIFELSEVNNHPRLVPSAPQLPLPAMQLPPM